MGVYSHSNWSEENVDLCAPGTNVWSTFTYARLLHTSFGKLSSTSIAAAHVTAAASLILSMFGNVALENPLSASELKYLILRSSSTKSILQDKVNNGRVLNVSNLINVIYAEYGYTLTSTTTSLPRDTTTSTTYPRETSTTTPLPLHTSTTSDPELPSTSSLLPEIATTTFLE